MPTQYTMKAEMYITIILMTVLPRVTMVIYFLVLSSVFLWN